MDIEKIVSELMEELNLKAAHNDDEMYDIMKDAIGEDRTMMYLRKMTQNTKNPAPVMPIPAFTTESSIRYWLPG